LGLAERGMRPVAVAGRTPRTPSTRRVANRLSVRAVPVEEAGRDADLVVVATPDAAIADVARALAPSLRAGSLVIHLSGAAGPDVLDAVLSAQPRARTGWLHPLQSLPSPEVGAARLPGSWCAIDGPPDVERLASTLGMRSFRVDADARARYHAAACVASNHLVALLGQVERLASAAGVPFDAFMPLVRVTVDNVAELGPAAALTGPVARGDDGTVTRHLEAIAPAEREPYRALAREALRLAGRDDPAVEAILDGAFAEATA
jgi:predicted short-subunit dehydrogenase-like oxidoreductase (DUF2520 family)